jgi:hypothetical protein
VAAPASCAINGVAKASSVTANSMSLFFIRFSYEFAARRWFDTERWDDGRSHWQRDKA